MRSCERVPSTNQIHAVVQQGACNGDIRAYRNAIGWRNNAAGYFIRAIFMIALKVIPAFGHYVGYRYRHYRSLPSGQVINPG